jgi:transcriptional activator SPT7
VPLSATTYQTQLPALFHSFFASRIDSGQGLADDVFDAPHSQIGSLGQIVIKNPPAMKKRPEIKKKEKLVKVV